MKKIWVHILFLAVLVDFTSLGQIFKVPVLVLHYLEHKKIDQRIDFIDFLAMHYGGADNNDDDNARDMQLPFKSIDNKSTNQLATPVVSTGIQKSPVAFTSNSTVFFNHDHLPQRALESLFHPPRL